MALYLKSTVPGLLFLDLHFRDCAASSYLAVHTHIRYIRCQTYVDQSKIKGTLLEKQCDFSSVSWFPFMGFS